MKRFFISADIEGTCGIASWDETEHDRAGYSPFADQMTREVSAACEGLLNAGADEILIRDAHDTARNIRPFMLPQKEGIRLFRGWGKDPYAMVSGLDEGYDGILFTGYHSACGWDGNPLSHTMNTKNVHVKINGEVAPELMINSLTAGMLHVPVLMVTGDRRLCDWFRTRVPDAVTVPVSEGVGNGSISIMPEEACRRIREGAQKAAELNPGMCLYPMPDHFTVEICYHQHILAKGAGWYPGARIVDDRTVVFESDSWFDVLVFFHFCL